MKYQLWRLLGGADFRMINIKLVKTINSCVQVFKISSALKTKSRSHGAWFQRKDLVKTDRLVSTVAASSMLTFQT